MKILRTLIVELVDLETFELYPGAYEFESEFSEYAKYRTQFVFADEQKLNRAENRAKELNLESNSYVKVELETNEELRDYPIVGINFHTTKYEIVLENNGEKSIGSKVSKKNFHNDIGTGAIIMSKKGMEFFKTNLPYLEFEVLNDSKGNEYFVATNWKVIDIPQILSDNTTPEVFDSEQNLYRNPTSVDGRLNFSEESIELVSKNKFLMSNCFKVKDEIYYYPGLRIWATGAFALKLKQQFDFEKDDIHIYTPTLDYV